MLDCIDSWSLPSFLLSVIHILPQGQTVDAEYYVEDILETEVKPLLKRLKRTNEATTKKMVVNKFTFQQDGAPAHSSKHAQDWCLQNLPNFINKDDWPGNSADLNPMESLFSILNKKVYYGPESQILDELNNESESMARNHYWLSQIPYAQYVETPRTIHC